MILVIFQDFPLSLVSRVQIFYSAVQIIYLVRKLLQCCILIRENVQPLGHDKLSLFLRSYK